ncbi:uncharacterized protein FFFS_05067 [Fusarium fujikuroi]|nr:uncharacterized protein FFC1_15901 [Fusarium fujikuroi]SCV36194.1 uncharacterized protein FFFS_05067 [Fusarium fujikuroi]
MVFKEAWINYYPAS